MADTGTHGGGTIPCDPCESAAQKRYWPAMCAWLEQQAKDPDA